MIKAYRIFKSSIKNPHSGEGTKKYGGRWNVIGMPAIYTSASLSLSAWEIVVNTESLSALRHMAFHYTEFHIGEKLVEGLSKDSLKLAFKGIAETQSMGGLWLLNGKLPVLKVPSIVFPEEDNLLINPRHELFKEINIGTAKPFKFDKRFHNLLE